MFFFNDTATTEIYTLSLHDALPILAQQPRLDVLRPQRLLHELVVLQVDHGGRDVVRGAAMASEALDDAGRQCRDRKSTRLNSSRANISYAVFCLKKKKNTNPTRNGL